MSFTDDLVALVAAKLEAWRPALESQADVSTVFITVRIGRGRKIREATCSVQTTWQGPSRRTSPRRGRRE